MTYHFGFKRDCVVTKYLSISVYMSDKAASSGNGCDPYSDDEDCYDDGNNHNKSNYSDDDDEGSGSGDYTKDYTSKPGKVNSSNNNNGKNKPKGPKAGTGKAQDDSDDEEIENWPPWVTAKPDLDKDIVVEEPGLARDESTPKVKSGSVSVHYTKALVYYLVPVLTCLIGSLASW